jgi:hypothetical protein
MHGPAPDVCTSVSDVAVSLLTADETTKLTKKMYFLLLLDLLPNIRNLSHQKQDAGIQDE